MNRIYSYIIGLFILLTSATSAQDASSLLDTGKDYPIATFKGTRLINFHTIETTGSRTLNFLISHRFGNINSGSYDAWGIDGPVDIRLGLEYSPDGRFMFGIGRTSSEKMVDGFLKYRLLRQTTDNKMPISMTLFAGAYRTALQNQIVNNFDLYEHGWNRFSYCFQAMFARKFTSSFSLQVAPWFVHYKRACETHHCEK